jgi:ankyrin repeat protein
VLIKAGAYLEAKDQYGSVPLHCACYRGHVEVVSQLLTLGADLSSLDHVSRVEHLSK